MGIRLNWQRLAYGRHRVSVFWDVLMLVIVSVNLGWFLVDALFVREPINEWLSVVAPELHKIYNDDFHRVFPHWDLIFVGVYVMEILWRWGVSIVHKAYHRWWFYPFVHWYDVLGSIPLPAFRFLRLFRAVSLIYRLERYGILDFSQTFLYRFVEKYFFALVEEVSDRVVVSVLEGLASEIRSGNPVMHRVMIHVVRPQRKMLGHWLGDRLADWIEHSYLKRQAEVAAYIHQVVRDAVAGSAELVRLSKAPVVGDYLIVSLEKVIADVAHGVLRQLASDLHGENSTGLIHEATEVLFANLSEPDGEVSQLIETVLLDLIDVIKSEVQVQKWKQKHPL